MTNTATQQTMRVPYLDLSAQHAPIKDEILRAVGEIIDRNAFVLGPGVDALEKRFAAFCDARQCVAVNTGTAALHLALLAYGIGAGDEVITQANTFIATVAAIMYTGARPVLVDVAEPTLTIDPAAVEAAITPRTKAILPVHLFGQPCDLDALRSIAVKHGLILLEDASQAHGALYKGAKIGSAGTATFSFYPGKNLGACGEGGGVVTDDGAVAEKVRLLRNHGSKEKYRHDLLGYNYRLEGIQGAILDVKTRYLEGWTRERRRVASQYDALLESFERPSLLRDTESAYHIYPVLVKNRDDVRAKLAQAGVETNVHYPIPCHLQPGYGNLGYEEGDFPQSERVAREELSLPIFPEMTTAQVEYVAAQLRRVVAS
ncbi:MAG TPA: DegT/DnrJ/EryC1/StrS family aminotransferase [Candidatus Acidoferrales bacterium]|nr:DegT/DnrJ/EryC1/StrS family aminotransferase [Candidatus Acidoferrales bacterium]